MTKHNNSTAGHWVVVVVLLGVLGAVSAITTPQANDQVSMISSDTAAEACVWSAYDQKPGETLPLC